MAEFQWSELRNTRGSVQRLGRAAAPEPTEKRSRAKKVGSARGAPRFQAVAALAVEALWPPLRNKTLRAVSFDTSASSVSTDKKIPPSWMRSS